MFIKTKHNIKWGGGNCGSVLDKMEETLMRREEEMRRFLFQMDISAMRAVCTQQSNIDLHYEQPEWQKQPPGPTNRPVLHDLWSALKGERNKVRQQETHLVLLTNVIWHNWAFVCMLIFSNFEKSIIATSLIWLSLNPFVAYFQWANLFLS